MKNPICFGLAAALTASFGFAATHGEGAGKDGDKTPLLDNLFQDGIKVSYKPGSGVTFKSDKGDFSLNISGRLQAKFYYTNLEKAADETSFRARRVRTKFTGNVFNEDVTYYLQLEHTQNPNVLDGWVNWRFVNNEDSSIGLRLGLQKTRGGLQSDNSSAALEFSERSIASRTFADVRGVGALLEGGLMKGDGGNRLQWHVGAFNNDTANGSRTSNAAGRNEAGNNKLDFTIGAFFAPEGLDGGTEKWTEGDLEHNGKFEPIIGVNYLYGQDMFDIDSLGGGAGDNINEDVKTSTLNLFGALKTGAGIAAQAEFWMRSDDPDGTTSGGANVQKVDAKGWYAQASFTTAPGEGTQWGFALRASQVKLDDDNGGFLMPEASLEQSGGVAAISKGDVTEITGGITAYYHKHKLKTQLNYVYQKVDEDAGASSGLGDSTNHGLDIMFTLLF